jgi:hypothetical protein
MDADGEVGCCGPSGNLYFCNAMKQLFEQFCTGTDVCGWSSLEGFYDCVPAPGGADPSGTYPLVCGGP